MNANDTNADLPKQVEAKRGAWRWTRRTLLATSILGLGSCNVLTLVNDDINGAAFAILKTAMSSVLPDAAVASITRNSPSVSRQTQLALATKDLMEEKARLIASNKSLDHRHTELQKANRDIVAKHDELKRVSQANAAKTKKISSKLAARSVRSAGRNVTSSFAESIPLIGVAVVAGELAWDVYDACETMKDANELNSIFGNSLEDQSKVCGIKVPTKDELLAQAKNNWQSAYQTAAESMNSAGRSVVSMKPPAVSWDELKEAVCPVIGSVPMICS